MMTVLVFVENKHSETPRRTRVAAPHTSTGIYWIYVIRSPVDRLREGTSVLDRLREPAANIRRRTIGRFCRQKHDPY